MAGRHPVRVRKDEELWEMTVPGRVWVEITNARGRQEQTSVGGRAGARLRIKTEDRELTQERIVDPANDPFTNGTLIRLDADQQENEQTRSDDALGTEQLLEVFELKGREFEERVDSLGEVTLRRLAAIATSVDAAVSQVEYLHDSIATRFAVSKGKMPSYEELEKMRQVAVKQ